MSEKLERAELLQSLSLLGEHPSGSAVAKKIASGSFSGMGIADLREAWFKIVIKADETKGDEELPVEVAAIYQQQLDRENAAIESDEDEWPEYKAVIPELQKKEKKSSTKAEKKEKPVAVEIDDEEDDEEEVVPKKAVSKKPVEKKVEKKKAPVKKVEPVEEDEEEEDELPVAKKAVKKETPKKKEVVKKEAPVAKKVEKKEVKKPEPKKPEPKKEKQVATKEEKAPVRKQKKEASPKDEFGFRAGTDASKIAALMASGKHTMQQIGEKIGHSAYYMYDRLKAKGYKITNGDKGRVGLQKARG